MHGTRDPLISPSYAPQLAKNIKGSRFDVLFTVADAPKFIAIFAVCSSKDAEPVVA